MHVGESCPLLTIKIDWMQARWLAELHIGWSLKRTNGCFVDWECKQDSQDPNAGGSRRAFRSCTPGLAPICRLLDHGDDSAMKNPVRA
jgi:hypothetical protein